MKIHVLCNLGTNDFGENALTEGVHEVNDAFGERLIKRRLAVEIPPDKPEGAKPSPPVEPKPVVSAAAKPTPQAATPAKSK